MDLWEAIGIKEPCVLACVGAGGKTSCIQSLAVCAQSRMLPVLLTSTTKMYLQQIADLHPIISAQYQAVEQRVVGKMQHQGVAAWFSDKDRDKVIGVPPAWIDQIHRDYPQAHILVEADGAKERLIKAPAPHEAVVPTSTTITVGVMNIQAIGQPLTDGIVHRLPQVLEILAKQPGECITWQDIALLAEHEHGILRFSRGRSVLLLTGFDEHNRHVGTFILNRLNSNPRNIDRCIFATGFGTKLRPLEVHMLAV